ncbi:hypothetical protein [Streptomyces sp. NPDC018045]|uniref:hypothetical protein n=1 Tax=Streptomyces sp. NPDC018045 TaxID=3365037 RepID=UPI00378A2447
MSRRARRTLPGFLPRALAGLWTVLLVLAGPSGTAGAAPGPPGPAPWATATSGPFGVVSRPSSAATPQTLTAHPAPGRPRADARTAPDRPVARQSATAHVHAVLPHPRSPGLPGALPSAGPAPHHSPFGYGETVGPRRERAPPWARYSPRSPRGPPFVRSR